MKKSLITLAALSTLALAGCSSMTPIAESARKDIKQGSQDLKATFDSAFEKVPPKRKNFRQSNSIYVNPTPLPTYIASKKQLPSFFNNKLAVTNPAPLPVNELINDISREYFEKYKQQLKINVTQDVFNPGAGLGQLIETTGGESSSSTSSGTSEATINGLSSSQINGVLIDSFVFEGTLESALNQLSQKAGISWEWNGAEVEIYRTKVKSFYVSALAGGQLSSGGSGSSGQNTQVGEKSQIEEMKTYILSMLSPNGKFSIMESSGMVTVRDTPLVLDTIERGLKEINAILSKQININFEIYEVELDENDAAGLDWNVLWSKASADNSFSYSSPFLGETSTNFPSINNKVGSSPIASIGITTGAFTGSSLNVILKSVNANILNTRSHAIVTKNGRITPIKIKDVQDYVYTVTREKSGSGSDSDTTVTPEIKEGVTGLDSKVQARVQPDGKILLKFDLKIEELKSLIPQQIGEDTIQLANKTEKELTQEITLQSGNTMIMSGIKTSKRQQTAQGVGKPNFWLLGGNQSGSKKSTYLIILVTPYLSE